MFVIQRPAKKKKGFTLIEVMVVITILGVLAAVAVVNYKWQVYIMKNQEAESFLRAIYTAQMGFKKEYGHYTTVMSDLDVELPSAGLTYFIGCFPTNSSYDCSHGKIKLAETTRVDGLYILVILEDGSIRCSPCGSSICKKMGY